MPGPRPKTPFVKIVKRTCKNKACRKRFAQERPGQEACSPECAEQLVVARRERAKAVMAAALKRKERREDMAKRESLMTMEERMDRAQRVVNKWIRLVRDKDEPCISCGRHKNAYDAGHYRSVGATRAALRFNEDNIHKQCVQCNQHKGSNAVEYRIRLVEKIGEDRVKALEQTPPPFKPTIEWVEGIRAEYQRRLREAGVKI